MNIIESIKEWFMVGVSSIGFVLVFLLLLFIGIGFLVLLWSVKFAVIGFIIVATIVGLVWTWLNSKFR